jgi:ABC-2 type transport system permease protein
MNDLLRAELIKLRTTRTFAALVGSALLLSVTVVTLVATLDETVDADEAQDLVALDFTALFILLLGVMGMAGEWRHRTITSAVLAAPDRLRLLAAKVIAYAVAGMVLSLVVTLTIMAVGSAILSARGQSTAELGDLADVLWRNLLIAGLLGAFGVTVGALVRNQVVAIVGLLVFLLLVEPTLVELAPKVGRFGPTNGAPSAIAGGDGGDPPDDLLSPGLGVVVMLGWIALGYAAGGALLKRRDLT